MLTIRQPSRDPVSRAVARLLIVALLVATSSLPASASIERVSAIAPRAAEQRLLADLAASTAAPAVGPLVLVVVVVVVRARSSGGGWMWGGRVLAVTKDPVGNRSSQTTLDRLTW